MKVYVSLILLFGFGVVTINAGLNVQRPRKVIIDTDAGGDDAAAILLAIAAEEKSQNAFKVVAITCTYGNTRVSNVESNVLKILTVAGRNDIPVYVGARKPLIQNATMTQFFGRDGMGDVAFKDKITAKCDRTKHASVALVELAKRYAGDVSVLIIGPTTNVALAMELDPNFVQNVQRFYIMGASIYGHGSIAPNADFNFYQDPESNFIVLNSTIVPPAILLPSGVSRWAAIPTKWRVDTVGRINSKRIKFLNQVEAKILTGTNWGNPDLILIALVLWPDLVSKSTLANITPVHDGAARGTVLVDYRNLSGKQINAILMEQFDVKKFKDRVLQTFQ